MPPTAAGCTKTIRTPPWTALTPPTAAGCANTDLGCPQQTLQEQTEAANNTPQPTQHTTCDHDTPSSRQFLSGFWGFEELQLFFFPFLHIMDRKFVHFHRLLLRFIVTPIMISITCITKIPSFPLSNLTIHLHDTAYFSSFARRMVPQLEVLNARLFCNKEKKSNKTFHSINSKKLPTWHIYINYRSLCFHEEV